ncbi:hypothetical protein [Bradyrhizobium sp. CB3481]|uniref:hypothetical protein n=1 Tax=Bradyrhizobium sp. CB3481 TaxID=3039158 RepID=UPI0024B094A1|nr:hypothetical protein [Bradyrhizobium sp. CB3481]WFU14448.1 hypothetical protein QA643_25065 [Bradyrhizobium sp. CB3481]
MSWSAPFDNPIPLPRGRRLITLKNAAAYITKLPEAKHSTPEWQAAMEALIGVMRACHVERMFNPDLKMPHWGKRKLKRDQ